MPLQVKPLTEEDVLDWAEIYYPAFAPTTIGCLWIKEPSQESVKRFANVLKETLSKPEVHIFKCIDTDLDDKTIAVAKWSVFDKPRSMADVEKTFVMRPTCEEDNEDARREFMQGIWASRREVMGEQPHVMLDSLICHPDHHRRGAGRLLVQWGLNTAQELQLPAYLEGSASGKRLYLSVGFEPVREFRFDGTKYGAKAVDVHTAMIRPVPNVPS